MLIDAKRTVLLAMFLEYQKDIYDMSKVTAESLELDERVFNIAVSKLQHEGYIEGAHITFIHGEVYGARVRESLPTPYAIRYLEEKLELEANAPGQDKAKSILKNIAEAGYDKLESLLAKIVVQYINQ